MAWSAVVQGTDTQNQIVHLLFTESVTGQTFANQYPIPLGAPATFLGDLVAQVIAQLTAQQSVSTAIPQPGEVVLPTPTPVIVPDPNAAMKAQFLADYQLLKQMQTAIAHNILTAADLTFTAQLAKVTSELAANQAILLPLIQTGP
jgi:hypothetical protein